MPGDRSARRKRFPRIPNTVTGPRVRAARELRGMSVRDAAARCGMTIRGWGKMEREGAVVSDAVLSRIASVLGFPRLFFKKPPLEEWHIICPRFREGRHAG